MIFDTSVIYDSFARLTVLQFDATVPIQHDSTLKRKSLQILFNVGLCPDEDAKRLDVYPTEQKPDLLVESSIVDTLGEYDSINSKIVIYDAMCQLAATALKIEFEILKHVVVVHEIAHAVTHLGRDNEGRIWKHFSLAESTDKELFAQIYPLLHFKKNHDSQALEAFKELAKHQSDRYNSWRNYEKSSLPEINEALYKARRAQPPILIIKRKVDGSSINMSVNFDPSNNAEVHGDGSVFFIQKDWFSVGPFSSGQRKQAPGRVSLKTLAELRKLIQDSTVMQIPEDTFGFQPIMDAVSIDLSIQWGHQSRHWNTNNGWGAYEIFRQIEGLFKEAVAEASRP